MKYVVLHFPSDEDAADFVDDVTGDPDDEHEAVCAHLVPQLDSVTVVAVIEGGTTRP